MHRACWLELRHWRRAHSLSSGADALAASASGFTKRRRNQAMSRTRATTSDARMMILSALGSRITLSNWLPKNVIASSPGSIPRNVARMKSRNRTSDAPAMTLITVKGATGKIRTNKMAVKPWRAMSMAQAAHLCTCEAPHGVASYKQADAIGKCRAHQTAEQRIGKSEERAEGDCSGHD